jgi:anti-sigma regulatory factor (Ser/Thr protein kinase)
VPTATFDETWPAVPGNVPVARNAVMAHLVAAQTAEPPLSDIALSVSEAVSNVVNHAYRGRPPGPVSVRVEVGAEQIEMTVLDEGSGMAPRSDSPGLGLGMPLIATVSERVDVRRRAGGGTRLCIWFDKRSPVLDA